MSSDGGDGLRRISPLLRTAIGAAISSGRQTLRYRNGRLRSVEKLDRTPVTDADLAAHATITNELLTTNYPILSEEGSHSPFHERRLWDCFWLVDPLDGTREFLDGGDDYSVNVALLQGGRPRLGVVYLPAHDRLYAADVDCGAFVVEAAWRDGQALAARVLLPRQTEHGRAVTVLASKHHRSPQTDRFVEAIAERHGDVRLLSAASALKLCLIADGVADYYPRFGTTMEWDTAAGEAVLGAVGGRVVDVGRRRRLRYNKRDLRNPPFIAAAPRRRIPTGAISEGTQPARPIV